MMKDLYTDITFLIYIQTYIHTHIYTYINLHRHFGTGADHFPLLHVMVVAPISSALDDAV